MNGKLFLDTNIVIALFAGEEQVKLRLEKALQIRVPSVLIGELFYGAYHSSQQSKNIKRIEEFRSSVAVQNCTGKTAGYYGAVKLYLKQSGHPIPENDIWISALAIQHGLTTLVNRDQHFEFVKGLQLEKW